MNEKKPASQDEQKYKLSVDIERSVSKSLDVTKAAIMSAVAFDSNQALYPPQVQLTLRDYAADPSIRPNVSLYTSGDDIKEEQTFEERADEALECLKAFPDPNTAGFCFSAGFTCGKVKEFVTSLVDAKTIGENLTTGYSIALLGPPGCGKTTLICQLVQLKLKLTIVLTNRIACRTQLYSAVLKVLGIKDVPPDLIDKIALPENIIIDTYQGFAQICHRYRGLDVLLILDEIHSIVEDAHYTVYGQQFFDFLKENAPYNSRIYMTATPELVIPEIWDIESGGKELPTLTYDTDLITLGHTEASTLKRVYYIPPNYDYLDFKVYDPEDSETLISFIRKTVAEGGKVLYLKNNIKDGARYCEAIGECQHIYADESKLVELKKIAMAEKFDSSVMLCTTIGECGVSYHDPKLSCIIVEHYDPTVIRQVIGRARVNIHKRDITVLIPDYSLSNIGSIIGNLYIKIRQFKDALAFPHWTMEKYEQPRPYVYYSAIHERPLPNKLGLAYLERQLEYVENLKEKEEAEPHAFANHILSLYGKDSYSNTIHI